MPYVQHVMREQHSKPPCRVPTCSSDGIVPDQKHIRRSSHLTLKQLTNSIWLVSYKPAIHSVWRAYVLIKIHILQCMHFTVTCVCLIKQKLKAEDSLHLNCIVGQGSTGVERSSVPACVAVLQCITPH